MRPIIKTMRETIRDDEGVVVGCVTSHLYERAWRPRWTGWLPWRWGQRPPLWLETTANDGIVFDTWPPQPVDDRQEALCAHKATAASYRHHRVQGDD